MEEHETAASRGRVVVFGEVLFDVFPGGEEVLGGAPFNVAWHLAGFGVDPLFVSRLGRDRRGEKVRAAMESWGMDPGGLQEDPDQPTGRVRIELEGGQPRFDILADQAWDRIDAEEARRAVEAGDGAVDLLYQGTLVERSEVSREALLALVSATGAPIFVDVNLRPPWWRRSRAQATLARARWVKLNEDELTQMGYPPAGERPEELTAAARRAQRRWELELLLVTRGEQGAVLLGDGGVHRRAPRPLADDLVDTVGAGDAFAAVMILGLLEDWPPATILDRGVDFAAEICRHRGATPRDRDLYRSRLRTWAQSPVG